MWIGEWGSQSLTVLDGLIHWSYMSKASAQQMNVSLTSRLADLVHKKVESGRYKSASEVVREGLRLLEEQDVVRDTKLEELRREIQKDLDSGDPTPWNVDDFLKEATTRYKGRGSKTS